MGANNNNSNSAGLSKSIANAGLSRRVVSPITLSATDRVLANNYSWKIVTQPTVSVATINNANALRTKFTADTDWCIYLRAPN